MTDKILELTDKELKKLLRTVREGTATGDRDIPDCGKDRQRGLYIRVRPSGMQWVFRYKGQPRLTFASYPETSLSDARDKASGFRSAVDLDRDPQPEKTQARADADAKKNAKTFGEVWRLYVEEYAFGGSVRLFNADGDLDEAAASNPKHKPHKRSWRNDYLYLKKIGAEEKWDGREITSLTHQEIAKMLKRRAKTAPVGANAYFAVLNKMFNWASESAQDHMSANPMAGKVKKAPKTGDVEDEEDKRNLTPDEIRTLVTAIDTGNLPKRVGVQMGVALKAILWSMRRPCEILGLHTNEFDFNAPKGPHGNIPAWRMKNKKAFIAPWNPTTLKTLRAVMPPLDKPGLLFPTKNNGKRNSKSKRGYMASQSLSKACARLVKHLGMVPFEPRDLRRTAATVASQYGKSLWDNNMHMLSHTKTGVTRVYDRNKWLDEKWDVARRLEDALARIMSGDAIPAPTEHVFGAPAWLMGNVALPVDITPVQATPIRVRKAA